MSFLKAGAGLLLFQLVCGMVEHIKLLSFEQMCLNSCSLRLPKALGICWQGYGPCFQGAHGPIKGDTCLEAMTILVRTVWRKHKTMKSLFSNSLSSYYTVLNMFRSGAGEMFQKLRVLLALPEDLSFILSTHSCSSQLPVIFHSWGLWHRLSPCAHMHIHFLPIHMIKKNRNKYKKMFGVRNLSK